MQEKLFEDADNADESSHDEEKVRCALQVVHRQWEAEQENSRRLATRANGILATIAAATGLGIFKLSDLPAAHSTCAAWLVRTLLFATATCILLGLIHIWDVRPPDWDEDEEWWRVPRKMVRWIRRQSRRSDEPPEETRAKHPFASSWLHTSGEPGAGPPIQDPDLLTLEIQAIREIEFYRTGMAALDLHVRNVERQAAIVRGQGWLARATFFAFLAFVVALVSGR